MELVRTFAVDVSSGFALDYEPSIAPIDAFGVVESVDDKKQLIHLKKLVMAMKLHTEFVQPKVLNLTMFD
jgi:hypothetical protein